ncbi:MAG: hypothetical protein GXX85_08345 [Ignavibacteria bacterium]|nr:hypothetical protein [Ignavibacteria bacterium]
MANLVQEINQLKKRLDLKEAELRQFKEDIKESEAAAKRNGELLHSVVEAAASKIGQDFFDNIVIKLSEWLGAECVLIGRMTENERVEAVPLLLDGKISHGFSYELAGSPCEITSRKGYCCYTENVINLFPKDQILVDLNAESYIGSALFNKDGNVNGVICAVSRRKLDVPSYAQDIMKIIGARVTAELDRIKMEEELKKSEAQLRESNAAKDKFFSILAHDLKNPLSSILGFSKLLITDYDVYSAQEHQDFVKTIHNATQQTYILLENLLTWSLSQQKVLEYRPKLILLKSIVDDSLVVLNNHALSKKIKIKNLLPENIEVFGDYDMLSVVFRNLISNAIKFTKSSGTIKIFLSDIKLDNNNQCEIVIQDNGVGITSERLGNLFNMLKMNSTRGTKDESGTGLGLVLCKELIEKHNGSIRAESKPGEGSSFFVKLNKG